VKAGLLLILSYAPALAAPISNSYTCAQGHEAEATTEMHKLAVPRRPGPNSHCPPPKRKFIPALTS
jgi:hypothetical protein